MGQALGCVRVQESNLAITEKCGGFKNVLKPGFHYVPWCFGYNIVGTLPRSLQVHDIRCEAKSKDDVPVTVYASVQYRFCALEGDYKTKAGEAFYNFTSTKTKIRRCIEEVIWDEVPNLELNDAMERKNQITRAAEDKLRSAMEEDGYVIQTLIIDLEPDVKVKTEMNEKRAAAIKAVKVKADIELQIEKAKGDAESKYLSGVGIARQRKEIVDGLRDSVHAFTERVPGTTGKDVMDMELVIQYFETMKEIGTSSKASHVFLLHGPDAVKDISAQIRDDLLQGNVANK